LREYVKGGGYQKSTTNQLIFNLKKSLDKKGTTQWPHKGKAIKQAAAELKAATNPMWLEHACIVPIPPSKCPTDPLYDDRIIQVANLMAAGTGAVVVELLSCKASRAPLHGQTATRNVAALAATFTLNQVLLPQVQGCRYIGILDDVLVAGTSYRAAHSVIRPHCPQQQIIGFFVARRVNEDEELEF
jgi:hypothetical protein